MKAHATLGVVSPFLGGFYFGGLLSGIHAVAQQEGHQVVAVQTLDAMHPHGRPPGSAETLPPAWDHVDGWIIISTGATPELIRTMLAQGRPVVTLSTRHAEFPPELAILSDNVGGTASAVRHLLSHGHRRIAFIGCLDQEDIRQRYEGYQLALREHGLEPDPTLFFAAEDQIQWGAHPAARRMIEAGMPCTAVVTGTDQNALGVMEIVQAAGYRIPEDLAIVGFDDIVDAERVSPPLTTVRQRVTALGAQAAHVLLGRIQGQPAGDESFYVSTSLILRRSCGCPATPELLVPSAGAASSELRWRDEVMRQLVSQLLFPVEPPMGADLLQVWPGVVSLVDALRAALSGGSGPSSAQLQLAWEQAATVTAQMHTLNTIVRQLQGAGLHALREYGMTTAARDRLDQLVALAYEQIADLRLRVEAQRITHLEEAIQYNYEVNYRIAESDPAYAKSLEWLYWTPSKWGCLGLWRADPADPPTLELVGAYGEDGTVSLPIGTTHTLQSFPPLEFLSAPTTIGGSHIISLIPVRTGARNWGVLALVGPIENQISTGREIKSQWATLLGLALNRHALIQSLEEKQVAMEAQQERLRISFERERALASTVRELGSPVIPLFPGVLLIPLVGAVDSQRAQQFIEVLLRGVTANGAQTVLIDVTGVPVIDTQVANSLLQATRAATLLGARVILVGIRPEIAQTVVSLGINLSHIRTEPALAAALDKLLTQSL